ncbi:MAG: DNA gyrase inhibitor YacG [Burkholderiales bacterium]|nr:DNA gyrase inhibitor YacG [Nitrosomonas sp.]MCP5275102.1 DNA gyrase inhibitor YacG [Burkholderiales bacterium]
MKQRTVNCPHCGKSSQWNQDNPFRPFCSERCKTMDLAQWAMESYRIPDSEPSNEEREENERQAADKQ